MGPARPLVAVLQAGNNCFCNKRLKGKVGADKLSKRTEKVPIIRQATAEVGSLNWCRQTRE
jgi:hypothetical protein